MIVHTLKMCTGDAGPEQSLVLFIHGLALPPCFPGEPVSGLTHKAPPTICSRRQFQILPLFQK